MSKWASNTTSTHTVPILGGRSRPHPQRFRVGVLVGALVVLAAWGVSELLR